MVDFDMDCDQTEEGWFDLQGVLLPTKEEPEIHQSHKCTGSAGTLHPLKPLKYHVARCGYINRFAWGSSDCQIYHFKSIPTTSKPRVRHRRWLLK